MQPRRVRVAASVAARAVLAPLLVSLLAMAALVLPVGNAAAVTPDCAAAGVTVTSLGGPNFYIDGSNAVDFRSGYTGYRITDATGTALGDVWAQLSSFTGGALALAANQPAAQRVGDLAPGAAAARFWYLTATGQSSTAQHHTVTLYTHNPALPNAVALCTATGGFAAVNGTIGAKANKITSIAISGGTPTLGSTFTITVVGNTGTLGDVTGDPYSFWMSPAVAESWPAGAFRLLTTKLSISPDGTAAPHDYVDTLRVADLGGTARDYTAVYTFQAVGPTATATSVQPVEEIASGQNLKHTADYPASIPAIPAPVNDLSLAVSSGSGQLDLGGGTVTLTGTASGTPGAELDSLALTLPAGASVVPGSSAWGTTPVPDPVSNGGKQIYSGPFTVGSGPLTARVAFDATPGNRTLTLAGTIGSTQIGASTGSSTPAAAVVNVDTAPTVADVTVTVPPNSEAQINTGLLVADADGDLLTLQLWTYPTHGTAEFDIHGALVYRVGDYQGDDSFTWMANDNRGGHTYATVQITVDPEAPQPSVATPQRITFPAPRDLVVGDQQQLTATADSHLAVSYTSQTPAACTVDGDVVTAVGAGDCTVRAAQNGSDTFAAADPVATTFAVTTPTDQTIDFTQPTDLGVGEHQSLHATATSGLAVAFASETTDVCTVTDGVVTAVTAGDCTLEATQAGDHTHAAATPVSRAITVTAPTVAPAAQSIDFVQPADLGVGEHERLDATASSALPVTFTSTTPAVCTVSDDVVTAVVAGDCVVDADQAGDTDHAPALRVTRTVTITGVLVPTAPPAPPVPPVSAPVPADQQVTFDAPASLLGMAPMTLSASASSGLPVALSVVEGRCDLVGGTLTPAGPGSCALVATQAGDSTHAAAAPVRRSIGFVVPADDEAATDAGTAAGIAVLDNDPAGVTLRSVTQPAHGTATVSGSGVRYVPDARFSGTDIFTYTIARDGRTAQGTVTVTVGHQRLDLRGGAVAQLAGHTARFDLDTDATDDSVRIRAVADDDGVRVAVVGGALVLRAAAGASGDVAIRVTATDEHGQIATAVVRDRVTPPAPRHVGRRLSPAGTVLAWSPAPTRDAAYEVLVDGDVVCRTARTACSLTDVLGPERTVSVRTVGHDATRSTRTPAPLRGHGQVLVTTVYFASGEDRLTAHDRRILDAAIGAVHRFGFGRANLDGYTDADGGVASNLVLSHHRTQAVARYLREHGRLGNIQAWHGEADPVASNAETQGRARNRRVEVLVRY